MQRRVEREWLDELPPDGLAAAGSRRDLQRLNVWMGNAATISQELRRLFQRQRPASVMEIGAGDGWLMLQIAKRLSPSWSGTRVRLVDKQPLPTEGNGPGFARLGWRYETLRADVLHIFEDGNWNGGSEAIVANLFLHHFSADQLHRLFRQVALRTQVFIAVEPRRSVAALAASRLVGVIGCNRITRHDAPVSVRAGFSGRELSLMWPAGPEWVLEERRVGCFSHLFVAHRLARTQR